ncbi:MAG: DMT family transporter, partial [Pseudomonadota bacterium]
MKPFTGILYRLAAVFVFALMALLIKMVSADYPIGEIVFARSFFAILPIFVMLAARGGFSEGLKAKQPLLVLARVITGVSGMFCNFSALAYLSLSDATAIGFAAPLFTVAFAALMLKEDVRLYRWSAVIIGLGGVVLMLSPHLQISADASE